MPKPAILCLDDQREVLAALEKDLEPFTALFDVVTCESAEEAMEVLEDLDANGQPTALIISDHVMPEKTGVDWLSEVEADERFSSVRKLLLTGLATHEDTIRAINQARIDHYLAKPWDPARLHQHVKRLLTLFFLETGRDYKPYVKCLDPETLFKNLSAGDR